MRGNLVLVGMMGSGKSTVGAILAQRLGLELADTDAVIEAREGRTIPELFAQEGEAYFRACEERAAEDLSRRTGLVIACGGGLPLYPGAMAPLKCSGTVVLLQRDPEEIFRTVAMKDRPLAQRGREAFLAIALERAPVYRSWADHIITEFSSPNATADAVMEVLA